MRSMISMRYWMPSKLENYIFISSSAVYPEYGSTLRKRWVEKINSGENMALINRRRSRFRKRVPDAILQPPYLYGPMNVYRKPLCLTVPCRNVSFIAGRWRHEVAVFHVKDMCRFIDIILERNRISTFYRRK